MLAAAGAVPEPSGYRKNHYRAPVPDTIQGDPAASTEEVQALIQAGNVVLIDVLPRPPRPRGLPEDVVWRPRPRRNIAGTHWLPNTGFGALAEDTEHYFRANLERLTEGDLGRPVVFYCLANCWMSWNAAKRAISYGYTNIHWYADGIDAWRKAGLPVELSEPVPFDPEPASE